MVIAILFGLVVYLLYRLIRAKKLEKRIELLEKRVDKLEKEVKFVVLYLGEEQ